MSYFETKNNDCDTCNELSQLSFYTKEETINLIKTMGLAVDFEQIILNLVVAFSNGDKNNIIAEINKLQKEVDNKQSHSQSLDHINTKTPAEIDALILLSQVIV